MVGVCALDLDILRSIHSSAQQRRTAREVASQVEVPFGEAQSLRQLLENEGYVTRAAHPGGGMWRLTVAGKSAVEQAAIGGD